MILASTFFQNIWTFIQESAGKIIATIVICFILFILTLISKIITKRYVKKQQGKRKRAVTLAIMIGSIFKYTLIIISLFIILGVWGIDVSSILIGAGIVTLAVTFGAQKMIADIFSGICIVFENYYDIDDVVEISGFKGTVMEIGLKSTKIINWRNEIKTISNSEVTSVINYSRAPSVGVVEIEIAYKENVEKVMNLLDEKLLTIKEQFEQIVEGPNVLGVTNLGENGYTIRITVKTQPEQQYSVERAIKKYVKELFEEEGIEIPYPQVVIHNDKSNN